MSNSSKPAPGAPEFVQVLPPSKAALTKAAIIDAGRGFLETRPFRDLTVGGLMRLTDHSRPTFYMYFNDLHGLIEALLDEVKVGIIEGAQPWLLGEGDPVDDLQQSLTALVEVGHARGTILRAVADAAPSDARLEQVWEAFWGALDEVVSARIAKDQAKGLIPEFDPQPVARALNRMDAGILIQSFGRVEKADKQAVLEAILRIWVSTLYPFDAAAVIG